MLFVALEVKPRQNIGTNLRTAVAFGATAVIVVGSRKFSFHGAHGAEKHIPVIHFFSWEECSLFAKSLDCKLYGISGTPSVSSNVHMPHDYKFNTHAVFILNLCGTLSAEELSICHAVFTPNVDNPRGSIKYEAVVGICLHYYASTIMQTAI